jgi:hypothetical protein
LSAQQICPGWPHGTHEEMAAMSPFMMTQRRFSAQAAWPRMAEGQQGVPLTPQPAQAPSRHTP